MNNGPASPTARQTRQCLHIGIILALIAIACLFLLFRLNRIGGWMVPLPVTIGPWDAVAIPLSDESRNLLGGATADSREYRNPLEDRVTVQIVVPKTFDAYREPSELSKDFTVSAQRTLPLLGANKPVRAWIWKGRYNEKARAMMLCWIQERNGGTQVFGLHGLQLTFVERLQISLASLGADPDRCIVRLYTLVHFTDTKGAQARRNLEEIAKGIYAATSQKGATP